MVVFTDRFSKMAYFCPTKYKGLTAADVAAVKEAAEVATRQWSWRACRRGLENPAVKLHASTHRYSHV